MNRLVTPKPSEVMLSGSREMTEQVSAPVADPRIGRSYGGYLVEEVIGRGGMGVVYRAGDQRTGRPVALKLMAPELANSKTFRERFINEASLGPKLTHPNIVLIHESGEDQGELYIAMDLIEGSDLKERILEEGTLGVDETVSIVGKTAAALDAAHEVGIVHRDIKPQNILIGSTSSRGEPDVYVTDFGLMRPSLPESTVSQTGQVFGSVPYMAPELIEGSPADGRADVYALGCVLYECLTGAPPFERPNEIAVVWAHVNEDPPLITSRRRDLLPGVDDVVLRALSKHPDDRFLTCGDLVTELVMAVKRNISNLAYKKMRPFVERPRRKLTERDVWSPNFFPELARVRKATRKVPWFRLGAFLVALAVLAAVQLGREGGIPKAVTDVAGGTGAAVGGVVDAFTGGAGDAVDAEDPDRTTSKSRGSDEPGQHEVRDGSDDPSERASGADGISEPIDDGGSSNPLEPPQEPEFELKREFDRDYAPGGTNGPADCLTDNARCVSFVTASDETHLSVEGKDALGYSVRGWIRQDKDGDGQFDGPWREFCTPMERPVRVSPGAEVNILVRGQCLGPGTVTTGSLTIRLYSIKRVVE